MFKFIFCLLPFTGYCSQLDVAKISEAMGHIIGKNLEELGVDLDLDAIVKGLKDESQGKDSPLADDECVQAIANLQEEKITETAEQQLEKADALSNGDQIQDHENHSLPAPDPAKYR